MSDKIDVGLGDVAGFIPTSRREVLDERDRYKVDERFIAEKTGFRRLSHAGSADCVSLAERAVRQLADKHPTLLERIGALVVVTQNPDFQGLPHTSALLASKLELSKDVAAFDVGLGCSGWVYGISIAAGFMEANAIEEGLLITVDPYSKIIDENDRDTSLLFGDAASATILTCRSPRWRLGRSVFGTDGTQASSLMKLPDGRLKMNGRAIFNFSAIQVPPAIDKVLELNGLEWTQIDKVVLHQGSRFIVDTIGKRLGFPERTPFLAGDYGNTVSSSIPLLFAEGHFTNDRCLVAAGFGVGLSWAATALFRNEEQ
jgi:3-oxoacyl-[acyl-carrier-protein] synthase III